jgi:putative redox protein
MESVSKGSIMQSTIQRVSFEGGQGGMLAARLDMPAGQVIATAIFAHCFTCSKDIFAAKRVSSELSRHGIAVLRFDFTGLGSSEGDFANTNFSSNCEDLVRAAGWLRDNIEAPTVLIGHSLGGAAVLSIAGSIPEVKAVATIGAPADTEHVVHNFGADLDRIESEGEAEVSLAGRPFRIRKQFLDDIRAQELSGKIRSMRKALMVLHSPVDETVGIDNAAAIFTAARHPKSFVSLDHADHLLSRHEDAVYAAQIIAAWADRYIGRDGKKAEEAEEAEEATGGLVVAETGNGKFQNYVVAGRHRMFADEPESVGGLDSGPSPYDFLSAALGACTAMTLRMYADRKKLELGTIRVEVDHAKVHVDDCEDCMTENTGVGGRIDRFERRITIAGNFDPALHDKILEIADKCPVHRTLEHGAAVVTRLKD